MIGSTRIRKKRYWIPTTLFLGLVAVGIFAPSPKPSAAEAQASAVAKVEHAAQANADAAAQKVADAQKAAAERTAERAKQQAEQAKKAAKAAIERKVFASVDTEQGLFAGGDDQANANVNFSDAWCRWNDGKVEVHVIVHNPMAAHITVHLQPTYRLLNAGLHGDGFASEQDIGVDAGATRDWTHRLDGAKGVSGTPAIASCLPESKGIDLG